MSRRESAPHPSGDPSGRDTPGRKRHWFYGYRDPRNTGQDQAGQRPRTPPATPPGREGPRAPAAGQEHVQEPQTPLEQGLDFLRRLGSIHSIDQMDLGADSVAKKNRLKELLRDAKYKIQGFDYDRVKAVTDAGGPTPWRTNTHWNNAKPSYQIAWKNLREWAKEKEVWEEKDEIECVKETGGKKDAQLRETVRTVAVNTIVGLLQGAGYASIVAPIKGARYALEYGLDHILEDKQTTRAMIEAIFGKEEKAKTKPPKKEERNLAKEHETRIKAKKATRDYVIARKGTITNETRMQALRESPEYAAASPEERAHREEQIKKNAYQDVWRDMRVDWIKEEIWDQEDEALFMREMGYDTRTYDAAYTEDFLIQREWEDLERHQENFNKKNALLLRATEETVKTNLQREIGILERKIDRLEKKARTRFDAGMWPPYYLEKGRRRTPRQELSDDADDET